MCRTDAAPGLPQPAQVRHDKNPACGSMSFPSASGLTSCRAPMVCLIHCAGTSREGVFERLMAGTAAGELDSQQLDVDAFAKRLFDLGATCV